MKVFQIAAVADSPTDRTWLSNKLEEYCKSRHIPYVLSCFSSGEAFLEALKARRFHIVFMDIYLSGISGVEAAQTLRNRDQNCKLVFLTSSAMVEKLRPAGRAPSTVWMTTVRPSISR